MKIEQIHSHLNGEEYLLVKKSNIWEEIKNIISNIDISVHNNGVDNTSRFANQAPFKLKSLNEPFVHEFETRGWQKSTRVLNVDNNELTNRAWPSDFFKEKVAVGAHFGRAASNDLQIYAEHMAFFVGDKIDVGIEILPMKELQAEMSSGVAYYEGELYNLLRQGRGTPAVPLVLIGVSC